MSSIHAQARAHESAAEEWVASRERRDGLSYHGSTLAALLREGFLAGSKWAARASGAPSAVESARQMVDRWRVEWLGSTERGHWGDAIVWHTAEVIADKIDQAWRAAAPDLDRWSCRVVAPAEGFEPIDDKTLEACRARWTDPRSFVGFPEPGYPADALAWLAENVHLGEWPGEDTSVARAEPSLHADLFRLSTPDPRFDPRKPVMINGYLYRPATEPKP